MRNRRKTLLRDHSVLEVILQAYPKHIQSQLYLRPSPLKDLKDLPKLRVSMTGFCNLPIKEIIKVDGTRHHLIEISNPPPVDNQLNLCQNTSSSLQISSTTVSNTRGESGVSLQAGSCNLLTQVGVDQQGNI